MIAADRSALTAYFKGEDCREAALIHVALTASDICIPPVVLTEMLSNPVSFSEIQETVAGFAVLPLADGYWERAGACRRALRTLGIRAKVSDTLIAQSCIDNDVALITRDAEFKHFARHCGLKLA